jgi:LmbE family N-acetylglucosaminyl deacetylase
MATAVFFHAHPDDEAIATGGTMAKLAAEGHRVVLVTATRGELGETPDGLLRAGESLAERRAGELAAACEVLGVARQEFLGYGDSGMAGEPTNDDPACFWRADVEDAATRLADLLREESADVLVAYDENGVYGHPDHIQVHRVGLRAGKLAATARVYMATINRDYLQSLSGRAAELGLPDPGEEDARFENLGVQSHRITTEVDVSAHVGAKRRAMKAHASQISDTSFFLALPDDAFTAVWGREWYIRVPTDAAAPVEDSLLAPAP